MIGLQSREEKIGERIGWSRDKIKKNVELCLHVGPEILKFAKENQNGRGPTIGPAGPKNERGVTSRSKIGAEILILAKSFQEGRAPSNGAAAPKNERDIKKAETPPKVKRE